MAMLGLRSLYFVVADALNRLRFVRQGSRSSLLFTAVKLLASGWVQISPPASVAVIAVVLGATALVSVWRPRAVTDRSGVP